MILHPFFIFLGCPCSIYLRYSLKSSRLVSAARSTIMTKLSLISSILLYLKEKCFITANSIMFYIMFECNIHLTKHPVKFTWLILPSIFVNSISNMKHLFSFQFQEVRVVDMVNNKYINVQLNKKLRAAIKSTKADIFLEENLLFNTRTYF